MLSLLFERSLKLTLQVKRYSNPNNNMGKKRDFEEGSEGEEERVEVRSKPRYKGKHDKPKPWDDESIDHWKVEKFDPAWNEGGMLEVSSFSTLFPQYREKYLQDVWPSVRGALKQHGISCELNLVEGSMTVSTTLKTKDPYIIVKARDLIKLLSRSVPAPQAIKILDDEMQCDIIKIGSLIRNKDRFVKRRQQLLGSNSSTLKKKAKAFGTKRAAENINAENYIAKPIEQSMKKSKKSKS